MQSRSDLQAKLEAADRVWGKQSLFYLSRFCLGYAEMEPDPHKQVCEFAERIVHRKGGRGLVLEPRGSFKTTVFSQSLPIYLLNENPNLRILLDSSVLKNSTDNLDVIKNHYASERFKFLFGDQIGKHWVTEEITLSTRTRIDLKEPSIRCASAETIQVGPHYDVIIPDDLVFENNSGTPEARKKVKDHFKLLFSLLEPDGIMIVAGTRWHYDDLYGMIIDEYPDFQARIKDAETSGQDGGLYFAKRLTREFLDGQKKNLGREFYNSQYKNDPAPQDEHSDFQKGYFQRYRDLPETKHGFVTVDPGGKDKGRDEWCIFGAYAAESSELYFHNYMSGNWKLNKAWDNLFTMVDEFNAIAVGFEDTGSQKHLLDAVEAEMKRRNRFFNLIPLHHTTESKETRIRALQPRYQAKAIWHSQAMGGLEDQLERFPKGKDDIADAAAMVLEIAVFPKSRRKAKEGPKTLDEMIMRAGMAGLSSERVHPVLGRHF